MGLKAQWRAAKRQYRVFSRQVIHHKALPRYTYRWDERDPTAIATSGFQPWAPTGDLSVFEHVKGALEHDRDGAAEGDLAKRHSQFVSTGAYGMLEKIDPVLAQGMFDKYLYRIDTAAASRTGVFYDVNDQFDRAGREFPYRTQREWLKEGGIDVAAVDAYMSGKDFYNQLSDKLVPPSEDALAGWTSMP